MRLLLLLLGQLANPSFEEGTKGWVFETGAQTGEGPAAAVEADGGELRFVSDGATRLWPMASQTVDCPAGSRVLFRVAARCKGLRREGSQYENANAIVILLDAKGKRLGILGSAVLRGDRERVDLFVHALAPPGTASAKVGFFSSMSGTAWFDDARLAIAPAEDRAAMAEALRLHFDRTYPYLDEHGRPGELGEGDLGAALRAMLAPMKDLHIWIETPQGPVYTVEGNPDPPNWNAKAIRGRLTEVLLDRPPHLVGRMGEVGYAFIGAWKKEGFQEMEGALDRLADSKALILDVRANGGGDELLARRIAGRFAAKPVVYGLAQARDPTIAGNGFLEPFEKRLEPVGKEDRRRVVVLQGPCCVSSTEWFLLMMGALDNVTTVGLRSRGATGNPQPFALFPGVNVRVPTQKGLTLERKPFEGAGIPPEEEVGRGEEDPALARALEMLAARSDAR
ncbi:MAG: S41 family peptidase [Planctomycetes bacterium]|nr:S41 family peptidase [Planctomycetota bacterium]